MVSTYSEAGVDIDASEKATEALIAQIKNVGRKGDGEAIKLENGFAGLVKLGDGALAICTDGVGSKLLLAGELDSIHTVGIDCVAMNVNDQKRIKEAVNKKNVEWLTIRINPKEALESVDVKIET